MNKPSKGIGEKTGPYSTDFGQDAYGHPTNSYGRCAQLNSSPGICPNAAQQTTYLMAQDNDVVQIIANSLGINLSIIPIKTNVVLVPLIVAIQFP